MWRRRLFCLLKNLPQCMHLWVRARWINRWPFKDLDVLKVRGHSVHRKSRRSECMCAMWLSSVRLAWNAAPHSSQTKLRWEKWRIAWCSMLYLDLKARPQWGQAKGFSGLSFGAISHVAAVWLLWRPVCLSRASFLWTEHGSFSFTSLWHTSLFLLTHSSFNHALVSLARYIVINPSPITGTRNNLQIHKDS